MHRKLIVGTLGLVLAFAGFVAHAPGRGKKSKKPPAPLNKKVTYEAYPDTDVAMVKYATSRREFRVGHSPYLIVRFHVAEFLLVAEHHRKYLKPDLKAEIQMAPGRTQPALMANKRFHKRWRDLLTAYRKLVDEFGKVKHPRECKAAFTAYRDALNDEVALAEAVAKRMFNSQQIRARELLRDDLKTRFRDRDKEWFDRLFDDFENEPDLSKFYPRFIDLIIEPELKKALELAEKAMAGVGLEYATAVKEQGDIID